MALSEPTVGFNISLGVVKGRFKFSLVETGFTYGRSEWFRCFVVWHLVREGFWHKVYDEMPKEETIDEFIVAGSTRLALNRMLREGELCPKEICSYRKQEYQMIPKISWGLPTKVPLRKDGYTEN